MSKMASRTVTALMSTLLATGVVATSPQAANATEVSTLVAGATAELKITGIDVTQAKKAGNKVVKKEGYQVLIDGKTGHEIARVPLSGAKQGNELTPKSSTDGTVGIQGVATGTCGTSYYYIFDDPGNKFHIRTGFDLTGGRVANRFDWDTFTRGENGSQTDNFEYDPRGLISPARAYWSSGDISTTQDTMSGTYYYGRVMGGNAYLTNGLICGASHPSDGRNLYL